MPAILRSLGGFAAFGWAAFGWAAIGLALAAAPALAVTPRPAPPAQPVTIPLEPYLGVLWSFQAEVDGKPRRFLLDTAGGITVISQPFADSIGCKPWGRVTGFRMRGDRVDAPRCDDVGLTAAGVPLKAPTAGVIDFSTLLPKDAPPLDGSVAMDAFAGRAVTLDLSGRRLIVETPDSLKARAREGVEVPVRFSREAMGLALTPFVAAPTAKGRIWLELDCGSTGALVIGKHVADLLGLDPAVQKGQTVEMTLVGGPKISGKVLVDDMILDGNIGVPALSAWIVTLDLANERAWIAPAKP
ncbi:hypothetical protein ASD21_03685 [Caulobacter sp. Root1455]|uniref:aspartyl protease family protein n=1 Tax=Caulobacter sp. Root1455 TaxID=1736465 RepID=UPI0006F668B7|nr:aspartyl protease family protein [Caulobacter sp. Root1455]KQY99070.1 hypothetical protein ASD21_03685 [Caulobacter sp. Root1455]